MLTERLRQRCAHLGHRAIAIPDLEAAIRALRLNRRKNLQNDVDFRKPRSSFRCQADEAGSNKETDDACDGVREGDRGQRKGHSPHARDARVFEAMGRFNEELVKAGVMLAGDGLKPSSQGKRVAFDGPGRTVIDGPFAETRELVAGFWIWEVKDMDEAVAWVKRCPNPMPGPSEIEIRPFYEMADFGDALTPESSRRSMSADAREARAGDADDSCRPAACLSPLRPWPTRRHDRRRDAPGDRGDLPHRTGQAHRGPGPHGAQCRPGRGTGAGRAGHRPVRMAEDRRSGQSRRLADGRRQTPRHRRDPPRQDARAQA